MTHHLVVIGDSTCMDEVKDSSVHLVVTSPPYWRLKDYGEDQGIGQTPTTYEEYFESMVCKDSCQIS